MAARIVGVGKHLAAKVLTNADLERMVETNDEWIVERTGIRERRIAADDETTSSLGAEAVAHGARNCRPDRGRHRPRDLRHAVAGRHVPVVGVADPGAASARKPRRRLRRQRRLHRLRRRPRDRRAVHQRRRLRARPRRGLRGDSRASSTGPTARPASSSAMAPARSCWSKARHGRRRRLRAAERWHRRRPPLRPRPGQRAEQLPADRGLLHRHGRPRGLQVRRRAPWRRSTRKSLAPLRPDGRGRDLRGAPPGEPAHHDGARQGPRHATASADLATSSKYGNTSSASIPIALCEAWEEGRLTARRPHRR